MGKAILVIDMPEKCGECAMRLQTTCAPAFEKIDSVKTKPSWCPLKPMPEKKPVMNYMDDEMYLFRRGWNACIDAIFGKE